MKYVKLFEAWSEDLVDEVPHQDLYETLEELLDAWKAWKENDDEDKDDEELHDEFMEKLNGIMDKVKGLVVVEEEEDEEESKEPKKEKNKEESEEESEEEPEEKEESEEKEEPKENEEIEEAVEFPKRPDEDLSKREGTLTYYLEPLLVASATMPFDELMSKFMAILDNPNAKIGPETRARWRAIASNMKSKIQLMNLIKDVYLAGSGMRTTPKKRNR